MHICTRDVWLQNRVEGPQSLMWTPFYGISPHIVIRFGLYAYIFSRTFDENIFTLGFILYLPGVSKALTPQAVGGGSRFPSDGGVPAFKGFPKK